MYIVSFKAYVDKICVSMSYISAEAYYAPEQCFLFCETFSVREQAEDFFNKIILHPATREVFLKNI